MAARKKAARPLHAKQVMRQIKRLASPYPLATAQARLDEIAELATGKVSSAPVRLNREEPESDSSSDVSREES